MKICAIHQPNYFPWIGYWLKLASTDTFILYDSCPLDEQGYTRRVRIHPNRGKPFWSSLELMPHAHGTAINEVQVKWSDRHNRVLIKQLKSAYSTLPYYDEMRAIIDQTLPKIEGVFNLASFNILPVQKVAALLSPNTVIKTASTITAYEPGQAMLIKLCKELDAEVYLSGTGAEAYLNNEMFKDEKIDVKVNKFNMIAKVLFPKDNLDQSILGLIARHGIDTLRKKLSDPYLKKVISNMHDS